MPNTGAARFEHPGTGQSWIGALRRLRLTFRATPPAPRLRRPGDVRERARRASRQTCRQPRWRLRARPCSAGERRQDGVARARYRTLLNQGRQLPDELPYNVTNLATNLITNLRERRRSRAITNLLMFLDGAQTTLKDQALQRPKERSGNESPQVTNMLIINQRMSVSEGHSSIGNQSVTRARTAADRRRMSWRRLVRERRVEGCRGPRRDDRALHRDTVVLLLGVCTITFGRA